MFIPLVLIASQLYGYFSAYTVCGDDVIIMSKSPHSLVAVMGVVRVVVKAGNVTFHIGLNPKPKILYLPLKWKLAYIRLM